MSRGSQPSHLGSHLVALTPGGAGLLQTPNPPFGRMPTPNPHTLTQLRVAVEADATLFAYAQVIHSPLWEKCRDKMLKGHLPRVKYTSIRR